MWNLWKHILFLNGMKLTLNTVLMITTEILKEGSDVYFLMTKLLNKNKLENTFSVLRHKGGNNNNPSVSEVNNIMANIMMTEIVQSSSSSNWELVQDKIMQVDVDFDSHIYANCFLENVFDNSASINLEIVKIRYLLGNVAFKVVPKLCERCSNELRKLDEILTAPSELLIFFRNYQSLTDFGNLVALSYKLMDVSKKTFLY